MLLIYIDLSADTSDRDLSKGHIDSILSRRQKATFTIILAERMLLDPYSISIKLFKEAFLSKDINLLPLSSFNFSLLVIFIDIFDIVLCPY